MDILRGLAYMGFWVLVLFSGSLMLWVIRAWYRSGFYIPIVKVRLTKPILLEEEEQALYQQQREETPFVASTPVVVPTLYPALSPGNYLLNPPSRLADALNYVYRTTTGKYPMVLGWQNRNGVPHCVALPLVGGVYHTLISGQSRAGKDNLAHNIMLGLALKYSPNQVQFCVIDGKGLDFVAMRGKAHAWHLALAPQNIAPALEALTRERERRGELLQEAKVTKWERYTGQDMPLLVVYISELSLLEGAVGKRQLTDWLNQELAAGAAFGFRYIVATQTASNFDTRWRSQISLYLAAFQPSMTQDQPNTGLTTHELKVAGGIPPSELPPPALGSGVFTCVHGREVMTLRTGLMDDEQRLRILEQLPSSPGRYPSNTMRSPAPANESTPIPTPGGQGGVVWTEKHILVASLLARNPALESEGIRATARRLYPGTDGGGSYSKQTQKILAEVRSVLSCDASQTMAIDEGVPVHSKAIEQRNISSM